MGSSPFFSVSGWSWQTTDPQRRRLHLGARHHHLEGVRHWPARWPAPPSCPPAWVRCRCPAPPGQGGEDGPEQEERTTTAPYGTAADQRDLLAAAEAGGLFSPGDMLHPASPLIGGLPAPAGGAGAAPRNGASKLSLGRSDSSKSRFTPSSIQRPGCYPRSSHLLGGT